MIDVNSFWIIPLLFTLNFIATAGVLIYLMYRTKKTSETAERRNISINEKLDKKLDRPDRDPFSTKTDLNKIDKEIKNRIRELAEKQQILDVSISNIRKEIKDSLAILALTSRDSNSINQNFVTDLNNLQPHNLLSDYYPSENTEPAYLTDYNNRQKNFADTYRSLVVEREPENYNLSRAGQTEEVILTEEIQGNYWLFSHDGLIYVVPSQKLKIREDKLNEVKDLFDCENYQESNYDNYTLIKPALVSQKVNGNWRLKEKGKLQFG